MHFHGTGTLARAAVLYDPPTSSTKHLFIFCSQQSGGCFITQQEEEHLDISQFTLAQRRRYYRLLIPLVTFRQGCHIDGGGGALGG